jgi:hypothetical protein
MLTTKITSPMFQVLIDETTDQHLESQRLLAAAAINQQFCRLLLADPELALESGFQGESFLLSSQEHALVLSIRADCLSHLAAQLALTYGQRSEIGLSQPAQRFEEVLH